MKLKVGYYGIMMRKTITTITVTLLFAFASVQGSVDFGSLQRNERGVPFVEAHTPGDYLASADDLVDTIRECYERSIHERFKGCRMEITSTSARVTKIGDRNLGDGVVLMMQALLTGEARKNIGPNENNTVITFGRTSQGISRGFQGTWEVHLLAIPVEAAQGLELGGIIDDHGRMLEIASAILRAVRFHNVINPCIQINVGGGSQSGLHFQIWSTHKSEKLEDLKLTDPSSVVRFADLSSVVHFVKSREPAHPLPHSATLHATPLDPHAATAAPKSPGFSARELAPPGNLAGFMTAVTASVPVDHFGFPTESHSDRDFAARFAEEQAACVAGKRKRVI